MKGNPEHEGKFYKRGVVKKSSIGLRGILLWTLGIPAAFAVPGPASNPPAVFIDCEWCDFDFIKTEIPFVNYVIDRAVADVHVLITTQTTGSGGTEYTINFIGQQGFAGMSDTLVYVSGTNDAEDTVRRGLVKTLKLGLVRYVARTSGADNISISCQKRKELGPMVDRWNNWVFSISASGFLWLQQSTSYSYLYGTVSANRTTEEWKTLLSTYYSYSKNVYKINDTTTIPSVKKSYGASGTVVKSLTNHWSAGGYTSFNSSLYNNTALELSMAPALEYDVLPYSQSTSKMLTVLYKVKGGYSRYIDTTIYNKLKEYLFSESVSITLETKQRWGSVNTSLTGSHYFHDFSKNNLSLSNSVTLQVIKGLSVYVSGYATLIHDQLSLSKQGLTPEDILLQIRQLKTQYDYYVGVGFTYSFGSLFSNVVNPRM